MQREFFRVAATTCDISIAAPLQNANAISERFNEVVKSHNPGLVVFPEMCITGYTCADLFHTQQLLTDAIKGLYNIIEQTKKVSATIVVGMPLQVDGALFNVAVVVGKGKIYAVIPKTYIPTYNEFYERRWWTPWNNDNNKTIDLCNQHVVFGTKQLICIDGVKIGFEICEDLWTPLSPGTLATLAGAEIVCNLSASPTLVGKTGYIKSLVQSQSARTLSAYVYASSCVGESTTDLVFSPLMLIAENGKLLAESNNLAVADIDKCALQHDRIHTTTFHDCVTITDTARYSISEIDSESECNINEEKELRRDFPVLHPFSKTPFIPDGKEHLDENCRQIINIQAAGLAQRIVKAYAKNVVLGISGGLDSTLALLVCSRAADILSDKGCDFTRKNIVAITMPGFGTTDRTHDNAVDLMQRLGVTIKEISIVPAVMQHFSDIGHDADNHNVVYENAQARQRTYILMDVANQVNGFVVGTGDMSELALGWATYNGDHMSMYGVNAGVPKTLVKYLVRYFAQTGSGLKDILEDILATPVSPELLPANADGTIAQITEDNVGPYVLHDFFLYHFLRYGRSTSQIYRLACDIFDEEYDKETIKKWLTVFIKRFFAQQFKRSCMPDGPKVGTVCLSPRGDWRMPSDASSTDFLL